ncbi:MAG: TraB/GumN family protein, partial [Caldimonas sp.]
MNRLFARFLLAVPLACVLLPGHAAEPAAGCPPQATPLSANTIAAGQRQARDHGFFWRVSKDGRASYLYGTIHAAREAWMFPGPTIVDAMRASDVVALELDVLDADIQRRLAVAIGPARAEPLPAALASRLERRRAVECVDSAAFASFAPEFQIASLTVLAARRDGFDPAYAIDLVLAGTARNLGKQVLSLETPETQMAALQMPSQAETVAFVKAGLDDLDSGRARPLVRRMAKAWVDGDYADLSRYTQWCECMRTSAERAAMKRL